MIQYCVLAYEKNDAKVQVKMIQMTIEHVIYGLSGAHILIIPLGMMVVT